MQDINDKITGNSLTAAQWNELPSELQNIIESTGQVLTGADLNQVGKAIAQYVANGDFYTCSGAANTYILTALNSKQTPTGYTDGMRIRFRSNVVNTGASTVDVGGLGVKNIYYNGLVLPAGRLSTIYDIEAEYRTSSGRFDILQTSDFIKYKNHGYTFDLASYNTKNYNVLAETAYVSSISVSYDGLKMHVLSLGGILYQYTMSTPWDISTSSYDAVSFNMSAQEIYPQGLFFKPDGLSMYMVGSASDTVYQYTLGTAWDISTASYASKSAYVGAEGTGPAGLFFKPDGLALYVVEVASDAVNQYTLSTAWDISTASYASKSVSVLAEDTSCYDLSFKNDGTKMYTIGWINLKVFIYNLSTAWDVSTAVYSSTFFDISGGDQEPQGMFFKDNGAVLYIIGTLTSDVTQYQTGFSSI